MAESKITIICNGLKRYYEHINAPYDAFFTSFCDENGFASDDLNDELGTQDPTDSLLIDFDPDFPFLEPPLNETEKADKILSLIRKCLKNPEISFSIQIPKVNQDLFTVTKQELDETQQLYKTQCPVLWNSGMDNDNTFLYVLTIGRKHNFDYLQHLIAHYSLSRAQDTNADKQWFLNNKHLKDLKRLGSIKIHVGSQKNTPNTPYELAKGAVNSFGVRCCPKLLFNPMIKINDSLEVTLKYISAVSDFIHYLIFISGKERKQLCPFQIDFCISAGKPSNQDKTVTIGGNDDDSDDDDDEKDNLGFVDIIGDIQQKLDKNKLKYKVSQHHSDEWGQQKQRIFADLFNAFKEQHKLDQKKEMYPYRRRFVTFIDRRSNRPKPKIMDKGNDEKEDVYDTEKDDIWMYEAPSNCSVIPKDTVPEWFINASRTCLLPNMSYGDGKEAEMMNIIGNSDTNSDQLVKSNIGASFHCKGALLTLSFIVKEVDAVKIYLYWNGQIIRFFPKYSKAVLNAIFDMKWNNRANAKFVQSKKMEELIQNIQTKVKDKYFQSFCGHFIS